VGARFVLLAATDDAQVQSVLLVFWIVFMKMCTFHIVEFRVVGTVVKRYNVL
jgi:hypothetical protein